METVEKLGKTVREASWVAPLDRAKAVAGGDAALQRIIKEAFQYGWNSRGLADLRSTVDLFGQVTSRGGNRPVKDVVLILADNEMVVES